MSALCLSGKNQEKINKIPWSSLVFNKKYEYNIKTVSYDTKSESNFIELFRNKKYCPWIVA